MYSYTIYLSTYSTVSSCQPPALYSLTAYPRPPFFTIFWPIVPVLLTGYMLRS